MEITLDQAEKIVNANPNLYWDGWNIEALKQNNNACLLTSGVYRNGQWHQRQVFPLNENGKYDLPKKFIAGSRNRS